MVALLLSILLAACDPALPGSAGSSFSAQPSLSSLPDPCTLLTLSEVTSVLGEAIAQPIVDLEMEDAECIYETQRAPGRPAVMVELTTMSQHNATFNQRVQFFKNEGAKPIIGIGNAAYALSGHILTQKPGIILFLSVTDGRSDDQHLLQGARNLTSTVLSRLP